MMVVALVGCVASSSNPLVIGEDAGAGVWPGNTSYAVGRAIDAGVDGIELDAAVTADGEAVVATDGVLGPTCEGPQGVHPAVSEVLSTDLAAWTCGGLPDPAWPSAEVHAEPVATIEGIASLLAERSDPDLVVELTLVGDPETVPGAVLDAWKSIDPPNLLWLAASDPAMLASAELAAHERALEATTVLVVPGVSRADDLVGLGEASPGEADGVALPWDRARRWEAEDLTSRGIGVLLLGADAPGVVGALGRWPVAAMLTGYPGDSP